MIVSKEHLRLIVGVLVIYCCIESTVGSSIRGVYNYPNSDVSSEIETSDPTMSDTTTTPEPTALTEETASTAKKYHHKTIVWSKKTSKTTTEQPSAEPSSTDPSFADRIIHDN